METVAIPKTNQKQNKIVRANRTTEFGYALLEALRKKNQKIKK